jgi:hypothetical protein
MLSSFFSFSQCRSCCVIRHVDLCSFFRFCSHIFSLIKWGKACQVQAPGRCAPLAGRGDKEARHQREPVGICLLFARHRREWPARADAWSGKAAEGVGDAAFGDSPEGHGLVVCKNMVLKVELRLEEFVLHVSLPFSFLLFGECLFCIGRTRGSTGCCICENVVQQVSCISASAACLSELVFCYIICSHMVYSVQFFISLSVQCWRFWAGASHDWKKNRMKKPVRQWKLREFGFFVLNGMKDDSSRMRKSVVHQKIWLEANCVFI